VTAVFDRFTDDAKRSMNLARQAAQRLHHHYLGTEHILFGILEADDSVSRNVLTELGVDRASLHRELELLVKSGGKSVEQGQLPFTLRAKKVLELAMEAARKLDDKHIGTEHLLLGLIREGEGVAAQALQKLGLTWENAVDAVAKIRGRSEARSAPAQAGTSRFDEAEAEAVLRLAKHVLERRGERDAARAVDDAISRFRLDG
jgi:ATP-dependent Clp protease ATP-binding subunit ClpC